MPPSKRKSFATVLLYFVVIIVGWVGRRWTDVHVPAYCCLHITIAYSEAQQQANALNLMIKVTLEPLVFGEQMIRIAKFESFTPEPSDDRRGAVSGDLRDSGLKCLAKMSRTAQIPRVLAST